MLDPFGAESTAAYELRERHDWASRERLLQMARRSGTSTPVLARLASFLKRQLRPRYGQVDIRRHRQTI